MKKLISKNKSQSTFVLMLLLYLLSWSLDLNIAMTVFGVSLFLYYPGKFLIDLVRPLDLKLGKIGIFSLCILYSFIFSSVAGILLQNYLDFNSIYQVWVIIFVDILLFLASIILPKFKLWHQISPSKKDSKQKYLPDKYDLISLAIFAVAILITIIISPLAQNADDYLMILKKSISSNLLQSHEAQLGASSRQLFVSFLALSSKFLNLDLLFTYRNIYVALFLASTLLFYDYLRRNFRSRYLINLLYLALLIPPVIVTEINIIRPQVAMLVLTIPVLILAVESVKSKRILPSIIALAFSIIGLKFHELSIVLVIVALISLIIGIIRLTFVEKIITWKHYVLFLIIAYAYAPILGLPAQLAQISAMLKYAISFLTNITWRWWFINNYTTMDGANLSWSGISAISYYLYNGILLLILLIALYILLKIKRLKTGLYIILPTIYFFIFFAFAEILPRIGLYFLPNRAWIHIMLAAVIMLALYLEGFEVKKINIKLLNYILLTFIIIGYLGTIYVANNNVDQIFKEEMPVAEFIRESLPKDCVIISSQENMDLVDIYGDRNYGRITTDRLISKSEFDSLVENKLNDLSVDKTTIIKPKRIEIIETLENDKLVKQESQVVQDQINQITKASYFGNSSAYFLYSYRKLSGLNSQREYKIEIIDAVNKNVYDKLGYEIVFEDDNALLLKIR